MACGASGTLKSKIRKMSAELAFNALGHFLDPCVILEVNRIGGSQFF